MMRVAGAREGEIRRRESRERGERDGEKKLESLVFLSCKEEGYTSHWASSLNPES